MAEDVQWKKSAEQRDKSRKVVTGMTEDWLLRGGKPRSRAPCCALTAAVVRHVLGGVFF